VVFENAIESPCTIDSLAGLVEDEGNCKPSLTCSYLGSRSQNGRMGGVDSSSSSDKRYED
jgi:hypothetical protein